MPQLDELFTSVEQYDNMNIQYLSVSISSPPLARACFNPPVSQFSKIGKVMRHIAALVEDKVPRNAEFDFLGRAQTLVDRWHEILGASKPKSGAGGKTENGDGTEVDMGAMEVDGGGSSAVANGGA
jgi:hypothetical protein